jgi:uncharacterized membrane protein YtjA (UPF0391 family)
LARSLHVLWALQEKTRDRAAIPANKEDRQMLGYSLVFLIVALIAGILGFGMVAGTAAWIAKVLFFVSLILFLISLVTGRHRPTV